MKLFAFNKAAIAVLVFLSSILAAQETSSICEPHLCACSSDISPAGVMIAHVHEKGEGMIAYRPMLMHMNGLTGTALENNVQGQLNDYTTKPEQMKMSMHMLMPMYGVTNRLTVMAMLQYQSTYMTMLMPVGKQVHKHGMKTSGLGDTKLYALYAIVKNSQTQVVISLGANIPTGSIREKGASSAMMYPGQRLPYCMQNGSGTCDVMPGLSYLHEHENFSFSAQVNAIIRINKNYLGYKYGNAVEANVWFGKAWTNYASSTFRVSGTYASSIHGADPQLNIFTEPAANTINYGGAQVLCFFGSGIAPQSSFFRKQHFSAEIGLPVLQKLIGIQMKTSWQLNANWSYSF